MFHALLLKLKSAWESVCDRLSFPQTGRWHRYSKFTFFSYMNNPIPFFWYMLQFLGKFTSRTKVMWTLSGTLKRMNFLHNPIGLKISSICLKSGKVCLLSTNPLTLIINILPLLIDFLWFWTICPSWCFLWFIMISFRLEWFRETLPPFPCEAENLSLYIETPPNYKALFNGILSVCLSLSC